MRFVMDNLENDSEVLVVVPSATSRLRLRVGYPPGRSGGGVGSVPLTRSQALDLAAALCAAAFGMEQQGD